MASESLAIGRKNKPERAHAPAWHEKSPYYMVRLVVERGEGPHEEALMRKTDSSGSLLSTPQQQKGLAEGVVVAGRYKLVSRLGRGGMGSVFLTWDGWLGRWVAFSVYIADFL